jgi:hypothetical protein
MAFVVALRAKNQEYCLYVQRFYRQDGREVLRHTSNLAEAKRYTREQAEQVVEQVATFRCKGRVEYA